MLPVSPHWILEYDGSWCISSTSDAAPCLLLHGVVWPVFRMTAALHSLALSPLSSKAGSYLGLVVKQCLWKLGLVFFDIVSLPTKLITLNHHVHVKISAQPTGGQKRQKQGADNIFICTWGRWGPQMSVISPKPYSCTTGMEPSHSLSCILNTTKCDLLTHTD